jgi:ribose/xylose/arabinose/galactoside ABC-type transport system permease subunit
VVLCFVVWCCVLCDVVVWCLLLCFVVCCVLLCVVWCFLLLCGVVCCAVFVVVWCCVLLCGVCCCVVLKWRKVQLILVTELTEFCCEQFNTGFRSSHRRQSSNKGISYLPEVSKLDRIFCIDLILC